LGDWRRWKNARGLGKSTKARGIIMTDDELRVIVGLVNQWCRREKNLAGEQFVASGGYSANANAILLLAKHGLMTVASESGRVIRACWTDAGHKFGGVD
jgi:hypothetical protein